MKRILTIICMLASTLAFSQAIPNGGFENWSKAGPMMMPNGWAIGPTSMQTTDAHSGKYALEVTVDTFTNPFTHAVDTVPGFAYTGASTMAPPNGKFIGGFACTGSPDSITGWYKLTSVGNDTAMVNVALTRWNSVTKSRDLIAGVAFGTNTNVSSYIRFSQPLFYYGTGNPDTAVILCTIGTQGKGKHIGSKAWVDDVAWAGGTTTGVENQSLASSNVQIYPNPAKDNLNILLTGSAKIKSVELMNTIGQTLANTNDANLSLSSYPNGVYFVKVTDMTGRQSISKFIKAN